MKSVLIGGMTFAVCGHKPLGYRNRAFRLYCNCTVYISLFLPCSGWLALGILGGVLGHGEIWC
jgi:hypothetical protein